MYLIISEWQIECNSNWQVMLCAIWKNIIRFSKHLSYIICNKLLPLIVLLLSLSFAQYVLIFTRVYLGYGWSRTDMGYVKYYTGDSIA